MERTPIQALGATASISDSISENHCVVCDEQILSDQDTINILECNHTFHRICLEGYLAESAECPTCKRPCSLADLKKNVPIDKGKSYNKSRGRGARAKQHNTRSYCRNLFQERFANSLADSNVDISADNVQDSQVPNSPANYSNRNAIPNTIQPTIDYTQLGEIIENTMTKIFKNLNLLPTTSTRDSNPNLSLNVNTSVQQPIPRNNSNQPSNSIINNTTIPPPPTTNNQPPVDTVRPSHSQECRSPNFLDTQQIRPDKVTSIIRDWHIKFDGSSTGISVDEFLYRVRTLTRENLNNDFSQLCKNLPLLLSGKAQDWFWRYHKQVDHIEWEPFCLAIKYQYKEFRSSFDIKEEIRARKMKSNENFETFYEAVSSLLDRLDSPMPEQELIEILTRNLRPEIRHELLYVPIFSIAHLRKLVQMRESLLGEDYFRKTMSLKPQCNRRVAEIHFPSDADSEHEEVTPQLSIDAIQQPPRQVKCWNCDVFGHFWEDCEEERKVFCYGCGAKNTYKPQCSKCSLKKIAKSKN